MSQITAEASADECRRSWGGLACIHSSGVVVWGLLALSVMISYHALTPTTTFYITRDVVGRRNLQLEAQRRFVLDLCAI